MLPTAGSAVQSLESVRFLLVHLGLTFGFYGYLLYDAYPQGIAHYIGLFLMISQPFWR